MNHTTWTSVDEYFSEHLLPPDAILDEVLHRSEAAGLPPYHVAPNQGKFLLLLAQMLGARNILEIGTLGGYSTIWLARALPQDGTLISLEANPTYADVAIANIARAGFATVVKVRVGNAGDILPILVHEEAGPFDLIFIDADKPRNPDYLAWSLKLSRPGTVILADNVVRNGAVSDSKSHDQNVVGIRRFVECITDDPRLSATTIQTVGSKGCDGFLLARVQTI